jgi:peptide/nickel transport system ATP-binding protein
MTNAQSPALEVTGLVRSFRRPDGGVVRAVDEVSFDLQHGETLGLVGESGCGKSSLARALMQLPPPEAGSVKISGEEITGLSASARRNLRRRLQMVFQDPISSLNPRRRIGEIVAEPLTIWNEGDATRREASVAAALNEVGFEPGAVLERRPHEMSGGQCQRVAIARALILEPTVLVLDEPVSALDVSVQAQILNLLIDVQAKRSFSMIFISHDLAVIRNICDRVAVMYLGKIVEIGKTEDVYRNPRHPYTHALLGSVLAPGQKLPEQEVLSGDLPSLLNPPSGCRFRTRCNRASEVCATTPPVLSTSSPTHLTACHHPHDPAQ